MSRRSRTVALAIVVVAVGVVLVGILLRPAASSTVAAAPKVGHVAPLFALRDTNGHTVRLQDLRGHPVLVNFFATWCVPCRGELPLINRLHRARSNQFVVLAVDKGEPASDVKTFAADLGLSFTPVLDETNSVAARYQVANIQPVSFWIDRGGVVRSIAYGPMSRTDILHDLQHASRGLGQTAG